MPSILTRADAVRLYLSGAASVGAAQPSANLSLGGKLSNSEVPGLGYVITGSHIPGVQVTYAAPANGTGLGTIAAVDGNTDQVTWTPPGASGPGPAVTLAVGVETLIEGPPSTFVDNATTYTAGTPQYLRVIRQSAAPIQGTTPLKLVDVYDGPIGMADVSSGQASAGGDFYRAVFVKNVSAGVVRLLYAWLAVAGLEIAFETPSGGAIQTIANETTAPTGLSWNSSLTQSGGLSLDPLYPGDCVGLWIHRPITAASPVAVSVLRAVKFGFGLVSA